MATDIVGEEFDEFVLQQIKQRQQAQGSGLNNTLRSPDSLQYLSNKNAWVKLASSVEIVPEEIDLVKDINYLLKQKEGGNINYEKIREAGKKKLRDLGIESPDKFQGVNLAKNCILFNSLSSFPTSDPNNPNSPLEYQQRAGITKSTSLWDMDNAYGLGGTQFGISPPPGIVDVSIDSINRGSIRTATVNLKAYNKFQFNLIEMLYLRLGYTMILEWGWGKYLDDKGKIQSIETTIVENEWFRNDGTTQLEMLNLIQKYREKAHGNYDGFFGKVKNFSWKFSGDGSYDITLELVTIGDVIESIQVKTDNVPSLSLESFEENLTNLKVENEAQAELLNGLKDKPIFKAATLNSIGYFLFQKIRDIDWKQNSNPNYFSLKEQFPENNNPLTDSDIASKGGVVHYNSKKESRFDDRYNYFIRLEELLGVIETLLIPTIETKGRNKDLQIKFDKSINNNRISYFPNQIPLDPRVCLFKPSISDQGLSSISSSEWFKNKKGIVSPSYLEKLNNYVKRKNYDSWGELMNLYVNFDFISKILLENKTDEFSLYKFLKSLCDGINSALGGVNKLEPVIKNDCYISLIDQTYSIAKSEKGITDVVDLEVYGYNMDNNSSNFVKSIDFQTKITPQLSSMISIGATAAGGNTKGIDATAFSKWNEGLVDRFNVNTTYPNKPLETDTKNLISESQKKKYLKIYRKFNPIPFKDLELRDVTGYNVGPGQYSYAKDDKYLKGYALTPEEFISQAGEYDRIRLKNNIYTPQELSTILSNNYIIFLIQAFGGSSPDIKIQYTRSNSPYSLHPSNSQYPLCIDTFINRGKSSYINYLKDLNNKIFREKQTPSTDVGFIPLEFTLNMDGLSGVKIYNKLNVKTDFLPSNYSDSLKFLISKVNHKISGNSWETQLSTLSIPKSSPYDKVPTNAEGLSPNYGPSPNNGEPLSILDKRSGIETKINVADVLSELNPAARNAFSSFFNIMKNEYSGYTIVINSINRTWDRQAQLHRENSKNAVAGKSKHNYGMAIDLEIKTATTKRTLLKGNRQPWLEEGIPEVAERAGLMWGGNFSGYVDCVHFYVNFNVEKTYNQLISSIPTFPNQTPITNFSVLNIPSLDPTRIKIIK